MNEDILYKNNESDSIWWVDTGAVGEFVFTFDKKRLYNLFADYPHNLTKQQVKIFDKENPLWAEYFKDRKEDTKDGDRV